MRAPGVPVVRLVGRAGACGDRRSSQAVSAARDQRGTAAVLAVVLLGVLVSVALLCAAVGGAAVDQRRIAAAADLGALAGASAVQAGRDGCAAAAAVVERNGGRLTGCDVEGGWVVVVRAAHQRPLLGFTLAVSSRARAGPQQLASP